MLVDRHPAGERDSPSVVGPAGRSTNGRSSAFGALCPGSNPGRPARNVRTVVPDNSQSKPAWRISEMQVAATATVVENAPQERSKPAAKDSSAKLREEKPVPADRKKSRLSEDKRFKLFSGTANPQLAEAIGKHIGVPVGEAKLQR